MKTNKSILLILLAAFSNLYAEDLTDIQISAPVLNTQDLTNEAIEDINTKNAIDGGDLLRSINGISTIRRGGHGLDPVIRGQSDQRLNSSIDGAIVYGACSSKMDPASTYVNIENYDSITVIKGSQSVLYGAGGPGGVVRYERVTEPLSQANAYKFKIGQTITGNTSGKSGKIIRRNINLGQIFIEGDITFRTSGENYTSINSEGTEENLVSVSSEKEYLSESHYINGDGEIVDIDPTVGPGALLTGQTFEEIYFNVNSNLRQIKVIKPELINSIVSSFKKSIRG